MTSGERGKTHTVITCVSASWCAIPPIIHRSGISTCHCLATGFRKCGIRPLNPDVIHDRQTAPSRAVCGNEVESELQEPTSFVQ